MATIKLEINFKFAKYFVKLFLYGGKPPKEFEVSSINEAIIALEKDEDIKEGDSIIFRGIAYSDFESLKDAIKKAKY